MFKTTMRETIKGYEVIKKLFSLVELKCHACVYLRGPSKPECILTNEKLESNSKSFDEKLALLFS